MVTKELQCFILPDFTYGPGMPLLESFLDPSTVSLKICGVTTRDDAERLVALGVDALGVNFWPKSKRYLDPELAQAVALPQLSGIYRRMLEQLLISHV